MRGHNVGIWHLHSNSAVRDASLQADEVHHIRLHFNDRRRVLLDLQLDRRLDTSSPPSAVAASYVVDVLGHGNLEACSIRSWA